MAGEVCWKCGGSGYIPRYKNIDNGICFACGGDGIISDSDRHRIANDLAKSGSKRGGKVSHLLKAEHQFLDRPSLEKYRKALVREAKKMGIKPNAGFHTAKLKRDLQEATGRGENGMLKRSSVPKDDNPSSKPIPEFLKKSVAVEEPKKNSAELEEFYKKQDPYPTGARNLDDLVIPHGFITEIDENPDFGLDFSSGEPIKTTRDVPMRGYSTQVARALNQLHNEPAFRGIKVTFGDTVREGTAGVYRSKFGDSPAYVGIKAIRDYSQFDSMWSRQGIENVTVHEMTHALWAQKLNSDQKAEVVTNYRLNKLGASIELKRAYGDNASIDSVNEALSLLRRVRSTHDQSKMAQLQDIVMKYFPSFYAMTDCEEFLCETMSVYMQNSKALQTVSPNNHTMIRKILEETK